MSTNYFVLYCSLKNRLLSVIVFAIDKTALPKGRVSQQTAEEIFVKGSNDVVIPKGKWRMATEDSKGLDAVRGMSDDDLFRGTASAEGTVEFAENYHFAEDVPYVDEDMLFALRREAKDRASKSIAFARKWNRWIESPPEGVKGIDRYAASTFVQSLDETPPTTGVSELTEQAIRAAGETKSARLFDRTLGHESPHLRANRAVGRAVENNARLAGFLDRLAKGDTPLQAAQRVKKHYIDYGELSIADREVFRRLMPFWAWTRNVVPLLFQSMFNDPGRWARVPKLIDAIESMSEMARRAPSPASLVATARPMPEPAPVTTQTLPAKR